ncbi:MAG: glycosyltransferase [Bacteroidota bacterium]|nr:glycosyltransferase [Bacteroidota bacterium]
MKILHLNTTDVGGAAVAALRLHNGLLNNGIESNFLSLYKHNQEGVNTFTYSAFLRSNIYERISSSLKYKFQKLIYKNVEGFNYPISPFCVHKHPLIMDADIIHLHWISRFISSSSFISHIKKLKKPIVWTLHDLNPITGGYHYMETEEINEKLNKKYLLYKKKCIDFHGNIHMVSPSTWIYKLIIESGIVNNENAHIIMNGIDLDKFFPLDKIESKKKLDINPNKKVILFLASNIEDKRKGLIYFLKSISLINNKEDIHILCVGSGKIVLPHDLECTFMGSISNFQELIQIYSSSDIFVIPSLEDNLPNTIIESLSCGTPVVGFNTGGIPDLIVNNYNGFLANRGDENDLAEKINLLLMNDNMLKEFSINSRIFVKEKLDNDIQSKKYIELYKSILNK